jgi:signal transduction histidine kinase
MVRRDDHPVGQQLAVGGLDATGAAGGDLKGPAVLVDPRAGTLRGVRDTVQPRDRVKLSLAANPDRRGDRKRQRCVADQLGVKTRLARCGGLVGEVLGASRVERVGVGVAPPPAAVDALARGDLLDLRDRPLVERGVLRGGFPCSPRTGRAPGARAGRAVGATSMAELEDARDDQARAAAIAERGRIARELHDVLAHSLSDAAIQLQGARKLADSEHATPRLSEAIDRASELVKAGLANPR